MKNLSIIYHFHSIRVKVFSKLKINLKEIDKMIVEMEIYSKPQIILKYLLSGQFKFKGVML